MKIAERMRSIRPFYVMELLARAKTLERAGQDVVHMEIGEPDFPSPPAVIEAGVEALRSGRIHYTPAAGLSELRSAIAAHYRHRYGVEVGPERIFVTPGASGAFILVLAALLETGDEVLLADPGYPCYANFVRLFGGSPRGVPVGADVDFQLDAASVAGHWGQATRGVVLASPSNPTGTIIQAAAFAELIAKVEARGGFVVSDEIYHGLEYGYRSHCALEFSRRSFVVNSFSKYYGMTGWRLGWTIVPEDYVEVMERLAQNLFISAPTHSQLAALSAFTPANLEELERRRAVFMSRRDFLLAELERIGFTIPARPQGAFYLYADCTRFTDDSFAFAWQVLNSVQVALTPGRDFGQHDSERFVRFAYTAAIERLAVGIDRLERFLHDAEPVPRS